MELLRLITELSHEFGTEDYVKGGGGNTSVKDTDTLWVKPSGTTLGGITPESFVALDRKKLGELYSVAPPSDPAAREALVKEKMLVAVRPGSSGRPSVEAPLHDSFAAVFVVHTHPVLVNGMTCAQNGEDACRSLFPDALWIEYTDPGFTLSMKVRKELETYSDRFGRQPEVVFLENHGVFVAADSPESIRKSYSRIMDTLRKAYREAGIALTLKEGPAPSRVVVENTSESLRRALGPEEAAFVRASGPFTAPRGPISPDHIVYSKAYPFVGEPTPEALESFRKEHGYAPRVVETKEGVFGLGSTERTARLALELARDGALVTQLAAAFGGIKFMSDRARKFIEGWEVEAYRRKVAAEDS